MQAKQTILDLWQRAVTQGVAVTFINTYGWLTAQARFEETQDAFSREDDVRIVKSCQQLWEDAPDLPIIHAWPAWQSVCSIAEHVFDEDYDTTKTVPVATRDPNINMHSEAVTRANAEEHVDLLDPVDYMTFKELSNDEQVGDPD